MDVEFTSERRENIYKGFMLGKSMTRLKDCKQATE